MNKRETSHQSDLDLLQDRSAEAAALLQTIGNPHRLLVLCLLIAQGEMSVGGINQMVSISPSALSQHLARMRDAGLVAYRREAQTLYYRIDDPRVAKLIGTLKDIFCP